MGLSYGEANFHNCIRLPSRVGPMVARRHPVSETMTRVILSTLASTGGCNTPDATSSAKVFPLAVR